MKVFTAHNADERIRRESSAGGVFSSLATQIINDGGIVYGAAFDEEWNVVHRRVDNIPDLSMLRGSKYVYSKFAPAISNAINDLNNGRKVLFSGTPCQVAAMRKHVGNNPLLLCVEVICHGAPKQEYWLKYLEEICKQKKHSLTDVVSVNFRDKCTGWKEYSYTITFSDGKRFSQKHPDNLFFRGFIRNYTLREACFKCPFKFPENKGDIILGDFWGVNKIAPELDDNRGLTVCIATTPRGVAALEGINFNKELDIDTIIQSNKSLTEKAIKPDNCEEFRLYFNKHKSLIKALKKYADLSWRTKINIRLANLIGRF